jgi:ribosomal protein L24E
MKCYYCGKEIKDYKYLIHIINGQGKKKFVSTCSEKCANNAIQQNLDEHYKRYEDVLRQSSQKIDI